MKPAISKATTTLVCILAAGIASAQNPTIIQSTRATMNGVSSQSTAAQNRAMGDAAPSAAAAMHGAKSAPVSRPSSSIPPSSMGPRRVAAIGIAPARHAHPKPTAAASVRPVAVAAPVAVNIAPKAAEPEETSDAQPAPDSKYNANGRRDPFISPVVNHANGSGCSTGKKCLEIGAINLRGVVHSDSGFIAVVSNDLNKAYFLKENDPVFNGYVVKITGDSIVFQQTLQDRLGKTFTREVVKKITTPAV